VKYQYDSQTRTYARFQNSAGKSVRDIDAVNNQPVAAANVVIIHTEIWEVPQIIDAAGSHAHDMRLVGTGSATIFRDGLRQEVTWSRVADTDAFTFKNSAGEKILFDQGQTWVHVIPNDWETPSS
jgi:UDP-N-acetylenolpyruvoylglucosamine reductase